jgi:hypothetical protein
MSLTNTTVSSITVTHQCIARQRLDKHPMTNARNNSTNVCSSLLGNSQLANELTRWVSRNLFSVWPALSNNSTVFSVRGPCRDDTREYENGNWLHWATLFLGDINTGTWPSRLGESPIWDRKIWSRVPPNLDPRMTALARASSNYKFQTQSLVRESAPHQQTRKCQTTTKIWS